MKQVYIKLNDNYAPYNEDHEETNLIYNKELNMLAISKVKEIKYNENGIKVCFGNRNYKYILSAEVIKDFVIN